MPQPNPLSDSVPAMLAGRTTPPSRPPRLRALGTGLVALALVAIAGPVRAGDQGGNLLPVGTLLLELDAAASQFRLIDCVDMASPGNQCDGTGSVPNTLGFQAIFDQKLNKAKDACLAGLAPPDSAPGVVPGDAELVSFPGAPDSTDWGIDEGKFALGARTKKGTGCGQFEAGEIGRLVVNSGFVTDGRIQVEAKQNASAKLTMLLDDGVTQQEVGRRYLLTGGALANPPAEVVAACAPGPVSGCPLVTQILGRTDGGPDSGNLDDGFWPFSGPAHNVEVYEILTNSDGAAGKLSIKGGGEFPDPINNRSSWIAFASDGFIGCGEEVSNGAGVTVGRTNEGACTAAVPYDLEFAVGIDNQEVTFNALDSTGDGAAYVVDVRWDTETAQLPIPKTIFSYDVDGVDCDSPPVDPEGDGPFSESCIGMPLCEGTPIRSCADGSACQEDADCTDGSACRLVDLLPPAGGFPDLVDNSPSTTVEYACVCEEDVLYLGLVCSNDETLSCESDADCGAGNTCDDQVVAEQCLFFLGDARLRRSK